MLNQEPKFDSVVPFIGCILILGHVGRGRML